MVRHLAATRIALHSWEVEEAELENRIKLAIGEHDGLEGDFGKITWKRTRDGKTTDFAAAFEWLANKTGTPHELRDEIINQFSSPKLGSRRFLFQLKKGWQYLHGNDTREPAAINTTAIRGEIGDGEHGSSS